MGVSPPPRPGDKAAALAGCTTSWLGRVGIYFYFTFILPNIMWLSWYGNHPIFQWKSEAADT